MVRDFSKEPRYGGRRAAARRKRLEDPADFPRMAVLVRAAQAGDLAALDAVIAVLTPTVLHVLRALWGTERRDVEVMTRDVYPGFDAIDQRLMRLPTYRNAKTAAEQ